MTTPEEDAKSWDQLWLPRRPLATDNLAEGIYRMGRTPALGKRYIETNPRSLSNLLVVDVDREDALYRASWSMQGRWPNALVENPSNGHAHAVWALAEPVTRTEYASRKATAYAAAVTEGLRRAAEGDVGYSGLITKNPTHPDWNTTWFTDHLYTLDELAEKFEDFMPAPAWAKSRRRNPIGLGRNCDIFESARTWAYREIRNHWGDGEGLRAAIHNHTMLLNHEYSEPLPSNELYHLAESIHRWITTKSRMWADGPAVYAATFITMQSHRGIKGGIASGKTRRTVQKRILKEVGFSE